MVLHIVPTGAALGAEVRGIDIRRPLDGATVRQLVDAWHRYLVLIVREQPMTNEQHLAFTAHFGTPDYSGSNQFKKAYSGEPLGNLDGVTPPQIAVVSNIKVNGKPIGSLGDGEARWHTDSSYVDVPTAGSFLHALEVPQAGGDTWFNDMYAALDTLPDALRQAITGKTLLHAATYSPNGARKKGFENHNDVTTAPGARHPMIRTHPETGRKALYLGRRDGGYVLGMPVAESEHLLDALWAHATQDRFVYRHRWREGDLVWWDNRCAMHRRDAFDPSARRLMHRTQTAGTIPV